MTDDEGSTEGDQLVRLVLDFVPNPVAPTTLGVSGDSELFANDTDSCSYDGPGVAGCAGG